MTVWYISNIENERVFDAQDPSLEPGQAAQEGVLPRENVEYGLLGGGCFVKKSRVEIFLRVGRSVYKQGQYVRPVVECTVEKGDNLTPSHIL